VLIQLTLTLGALLGAQYSLLNWMFNSEAKPTEAIVVAPFGFLLLSGPKQEVELKIRLAIVAAGFAALFVHEAVAYWIPRRNLLQFRKEYIDLEKDDWQTQLHHDVRINLMFAKRRWYTLWLLPVFEWTWNDGFKPEHRDANMWICVLQGAYGQAYRTRTAQFASIPAGSFQALTPREKWLLGNRYHLTKRQLRKTRHVLAVLSIPIVKRTDGLSPRYKAVGVMNLDSDTSDGAAILGPESA